MNTTGLRNLGWKSCFESQLTVEEARLTVVSRIGAHFGGHVLCLTEAGEISVPVSLLTPACGALAVGDWVLLDPSTERGVRRLERESLIARKAAGEKVQSQLIAANLDTLFIVSSCNHDFNLSRLERYLALAVEADVDPVIVITKADQCDDSDRFRREAESVHRGVLVEMLDARDRDQANCLSSWCRVGKTVALVGSSGVGKSTLATTLGAGELATQTVREDDSRGRHTTTARSIHRLAAGGLLIDTPGMRELQLSDCEEGLDEVFDEIVQLAEACRFRDCTHQGEPGCAVQASIDAGELELRRFANYQKLQAEQARNSRSLREQRHESRKLGRFYKSVQSSKRRRQHTEGEI